MLAAYLICLIVGGVFVGISAFAGHDDGGGDHDVGHDADHPGHFHDALPFTSLRFWTFGAFLFGLCGLALTELAGLDEPFAALASLGVGLAGGTATALILRQLGKPVGAPPDAKQLVGQTAELLLPLEPGALSKVRLSGAGTRDLIVTLAEKGRALPKGTRVVVLEIDAEGRARVAPEAALFSEKEEA